MFLDPFGVCYSHFNPSVRSIACCLLLGMPCAALVDFLVCVHVYQAQISREYSSLGHVCCELDKWNMLLECTEDFMCQLRFNFDVHLRCNIEGFHWLVVCHSTRHQPRSFEIHGSQKQHNPSRHDDQN